MQVRRKATVPSTGWSAVECLEPRQLFSASPGFVYNPSTGDVTFSLNGFSAGQVQALTLYSSPAMFKTGVTGAYIATQVAGGNGLDIDSTTEEFAVNFSGFTTSTLDMGDILPANLTLAAVTGDVTGYYAYQGGPTGTTGDGVLANITVIGTPMVVTVTPEDNAGNGVAAGSAAKGQRSMETQVAVVFNEPVNLATGAFGMGLVNNYGSGTNNGAPDTPLAGVLGTPANPSGDGETWIIPILSNATNSYALQGTHGGISGASLNNGVYDLNVTASDVTAAVGGMAMTANYTSATWHRLYGDVDNARRVFNTEYSAFLATFTSTYKSNGATNYNQDLDYDGDGRVFNSDYAAFLGNFGSVKIYSEPQS
jgi:hypothetical protein